VELVYAVLRQGSIRVVSGFCQENARKTLAGSCTAITRPKGLIRLEPIEGQTKSCVTAHPEGIYAGAFWKASWPMVICQCRRRRRNAGMSREPCVTATISTACRSARVR
jgi:hypothetical protein